MACCDLGSLIVEIRISDIDAGWGAPDLAQVKARGPRIKNDRGIVQNGAVRFKNYKTVKKKKVLLITVSHAAPAGA